MSNPLKLDGVIPRADSDHYGRLTVPGAIDRLHDRRLRRISAARNSFDHRARNGVHDPLTYFHIIDTLLNIAPGTRFTAAQLAERLNTTRPTFWWDAVTVGRTLGDLIDTFAEVNPGDDFQPLIAWRFPSARRYELTGRPQAHAALLNLFEDLIGIGRAVLDAEAKGEPPRRMTSPLAACASVYQPPADGDN